MSITEIPALDRRSASFKEKVNTYFGEILPTFTTQLNAEIARINTLGAGAYSATSTTSVTIGTGDQTLTIEAGKGFVGGQYVAITDAADIDNYMRGVVTAYDSATGVLDVTVDAVGGGGVTKADWTIVVSLQSASGWEIGDVRYSVESPGSDWLPCDRSIYLQASYPDLYAKLPLILDHPSNIWTFVENTTSAASAVIMSIAWTGTKFVMVGNQYIYTVGTAYNSTLTSISHGLGGAYTFSGVVSNGLATGNITLSFNSGTQTVMARSTDEGSTWGGITIPSSNLVCCGYGNGRFILAGDSSLIWSDDGSSWTKITTTLRFIKVAHVIGDTWIAITGTDQNQCSISIDNGLTWSTESSIGFTAYCIAVLDGHIFIGSKPTSTSGAVYRSVDNGDSWELVLSTSLIYGVYGLTVAGGSIIAVGNKTSPYYVAVSNDSGKTWGTVLSAYPYVGVSANYPFFSDPAYGGGVVACPGRASAPYSYMVTSSKVLTYNTSTQFCTPEAPLSSVVKPYIKAL